MSTVSFNYTNKKVIVTGAAGMFGSWISKAFHLAGADLWLIDIDEDKLLNFTKAFKGDRVRLSTFDLTEETSVQIFLKRFSVNGDTPIFLLITLAFIPMGNYLIPIYVGGIKLWI